MIPDCHFIAAQHMQPELYLGHVRKKSCYSGTRIWLAIGLTLGILASPIALIMESFGLAGYLFFGSIGGYLLTIVIIDIADLLIDLNRRTNSRV